MLMKIQLENRQPVTNFYKFEEVLKGDGLIPTLPYVFLSLLKSISHTVILMTERLLFLSRKEQISQILVERIHEYSQYLFLIL
uniref:Ovule protein n=1 Tax=Caenorhabditis tropicalis TaxID=1561998 RepID=A0A1I7SXX4_9PELO